MELWTSDESLCESKQRSKSCAANIYLAFHGRVSPLSSPSIDFLPADGM